MKVSKVFWGLCFLFAGAGVVFSFGGVYLVVKLVTEGLYLIVLGAVLMGFAGIMAAAAKFEEEGR